MKTEETMGMNTKLAIECIETQRQFVDDMTKEAFDMAIKALEAQEWVSCKERLPDIDEEVLVTYSIDRRKERFVYTANWSGEEWHSVWDEFMTLGHTITHHAWKNLPEPYNEDKK